MIRHAERFGTLRSGAGLSRLYWSMRVGMAIIWLWTAWVSWYAYPHAASLAWLRICGFTVHTELLFAGSCLLDLGMGIASLGCGRAWVWRAQSALVAGYTIVIGVCLPEFLLHPFGPLLKNIAVLACLGFLEAADRKG